MRGSMLSAIAAVLLAANLLSPGWADETTPKPGKKDSERKPVIAVNVAIPLNGIGAGQDYNVYMVRENPLRGAPTSGHCGRSICCTKKLATAGWWRCSWSSFETGKIASVSLASE